MLDRDIGRPDRVKMILWQPEIGLESTNRKVRNTQDFSSKYTFIFNNFNSFGVYMSAFEIMGTRVEYFCASWKNVISWEVNWEKVGGIKYNMAWIRPSNICLVLRSNEISLSRHS